MWNSKTPSQLQVDSDRILDVFNKTVKDLQSVNSKADEGIRQREEEKAKIEEELTQLNSIKQKNEKVINKINTFLEE